MLKIEYKKINLANKIANIMSKLRFFHFFGHVALGAQAICKKLGVLAEQGKISPLIKEFLELIFVYNWQTRASIADLRQHPWLSGVLPFVGAK